MRIKFSLSVCFLLLLSANNMFAQEKPYKLIKFGIKGFGGVTDTTYLNTMVIDWFDKVLYASNAEYISEPVFLPFNIEYGYQPFFVVQPLNFLQLGVKADYSFSHLKGIFQNKTFNQDYELNIKSKSYIPGIYAILALGKLELGGGLFRAYTQIELIDGFFGYNGTWHGQNAGYELSLGFSTTKIKSLGFTMSLRYRDLVINELKDELNRKVTWSNSYDNMSLNMTGLFIEMGLYLQLIKINWRQNEKQNIH